MEDVLRELDLAALIPNFAQNKVDSLKICSSLSDGELKCLGLDTIGDRVRFREAVRRQSVRGGRRGVSLQQILQFVTGTDEVPILGFSLTPSIHFTVVDTSFIPTANTCINCLNLPRPTLETSLPTDEHLFSLYDYAFQNAFYEMF